MQFLTTFTPLTHELKISMVYSRQNATIYSNLQVSETVHVTVEPEIHGDSLICSFLSCGTGHQIVRR